MRIANSSVVRRFSICRQAAQENSTNRTAIFRSRVKGTFDRYSRSAHVSLPLWRCSRVLSKRTGTACVGLVWWLGDGWCLFYSIRSSTMSYCVCWRCLFSALSSYCIMSTFNRIVTGPVIFPVPSRRRLSSYLAPSTWSGRSRDWYKASVFSVCLLLYEASIVRKRQVFFRTVTS